MSTIEKRTVLIINEDAANSRELSNLLVDMGFDNYIELSYKRASAWLGHGNDPLFTFLDIRQSGSAGLKSLTCLREINAAVPVIVVGSSTQLRVIVEAVQLGASDYIVAPFDFQQARLAIEH